MEPAALKYMVPLSYSNFAKRAGTKEKENKSIVNKAENGGTVAAAEKEEYLKV